MRWLKDDRKEAVRTLLAEECRAFPIPMDEQQEPSTAGPRPQSPTSSSSEEDFEDEDIASFDPDQEVMDYLKGGSKLTILDSFPTIKKISLKYNTPPASSAPVERLFSLGSLVLTPRRNRLSDKRFERLLLMRYNHCFSEKPLKPVN